MGRPDVQNSIKSSTDPDLLLNQTDGDIRVFLGHPVAALQTVFPEACAETRVQLEAEGLPALPVLAGCLGNDLDDLEESLDPVR